MMREWSHIPWVVLGSFLSTSPIQSSSSEVATVKNDIDYIRSEQANDMNETGFAAMGQHWLKRVKTTLDLKSAHLEKWCENDHIFLE